MDRKTIGRYEIIGELGRGGMGSVLRARDPAVGRTVALKCILSGALAGDQTNEFRERFFREARAAGALAHPGIVPVFDVGEDDGVPFLVMELVQGHTLADALKKGERFSLERVCEIGQHIAEALGYAHRNGVVHRDIKPANILMTSREVYGAERPRITDFGVAKLAGGEITITGQILGTPAFMPPEQFTGAPIDGRTDLFSLGVILYRMATGEQPFSGETITAVSYKIVHTDPIPPSKLNPAVGSRLEAVLLRCLAKSPADRYQTGEELAANLAALRPGARVPGFAAPTAEPTPAGFDPGETLDVTSGPLAKTFAGQPSAPQWTNPQGNPAFGPAIPAAPAPPWPPAPPQQWIVPPGNQGPRPFAPPASSPLRPAPPVPDPVRAGSEVAQPAPATRSASAGVTAPVMTTNPVMRTIRTTVPRAPIEDDDSGEDDGPSARSGQTMPLRNERTPKKGIPIFTWLILGAVAIVATRYLLQSRVQQALQQASDSAQNIPAAPFAGYDPAAAPVNLNPRDLDPGRSSRLRLGLDSVPSAIVLAVQMDGQPYWTGAAGKSSGNDLYVPLGRHVFRVVVYAGGGASPISSNSAGGEFSIRKRLLLNAELRPEPAPGAAVLPHGTRIILTVKPDPFSM